MEQMLYFKFQKSEFKQSHFLGFLHFSFQSRNVSIASTLRGQSSALASNDAVQSYSQILSSV